MIRSFITLILSAFFVSAAFAGTTTAVETRGVLLSSKIIKVAGHCVNHSYLGLFDEYTYTSNFGYMKNEITRHYLVNVVTVTKWGGKKEVTETIIPDSFTVLDQNNYYEDGAQGSSSYSTANDCESMRQTYKSMIGQSSK